VSLDAAARESVDPVRTLRTLAAPLALCAALACAHAPPPAPTAPPAALGPPPPPAAPRPPPPALKVEALAFFVGTWHAAAEEPTSGRKFAMRYRLEPVLGGAWLEGTGDAPEIDLHVRDYWGRDPVSGELVRLVVQSDRTWGLVRGGGWDGDVLRFEGTARSPLGETAVRETINRLGPDEFRAVWEANLDGEWKAYSVERLVRDRGP
jgi:hypothetical protein